MQRWGTRMLIVLVFVVGLASVYNCGGTNGGEVPASPSNLQVDSTTLDSVTLSWVDNADNEDGFYLERGDTDTGPWSVIVLSNQNIQGHTDSSLNTGTTYYYRTCSFNSDGRSPYTDVVSAVTTGPAAPTGLQVDTTTQDSVTLSWVDNATNETGFYVQAAATAAGAFTTVATLGQDLETYTQSTLDFNTHYYFKVCAYNGDGNSSYTNVVLATTQPGPGGGPPIPAIADSLGYIYMTARDSSGYETTSVSYFWAGPDNAWGTSDDGIDSYGIPTYSLDNTIAYKEIYGEAGSDGDWFTGDDVITGRNTFAYDSSGNRIERVRYDDPGSDGIWNGGNEGIYRYDNFYYDSNSKKTREIFYDDPGVDGDWFATDDNVVQRIYKYSDDLYGIQDLRIQSRGAGIDGDWFTPDDIIQNYYTHDHYSNGYRLLRRSYHDGDDDTWFTSDDEMGWWALYVRDPDGKMLGEYEFWGPGTDGVWFE